MIDFRLGRYQDVLQDVMCDAVICDPPYSEKVHTTDDSGGSDGSERRSISYNYFTDTDIKEFTEFWADRCGGWFAVMSCDILCPVWREAFEDIGLCSFAPVPCVIRGMTVRLSGDGPSSWTVYLNVARPKTHKKWGTLRGAYITNPARDGHIGGKPLELMNAIIRDYSKPNDLICDPCAGGATTLIAAVSQGRRAVGCEMDAETYAKAKARIDAGYTQDMFVA